MGDFTDTQRRAARENPLDLIALAHPEYDFAPVHDLYAEIIVNATFAATHPKVKMPRKFLEIGPPRHSKSESITIGGAAWAISKFPTLQIAIASYEFGLAEGFARQARETVRYTGREVFGVALSEMTSAADHWSLTSAANPDRSFSGNVKAYGIGSALLGRGYNIAILDDMTKPMDSPKIREDTYQWYRGSLLSRREPGAATILLGQRVFGGGSAGGGDLIERVLLDDGVYDPDANPDGWAVYCLPLFAEPIDARHIPGLIGKRPDLLGRKAGAELWPGHLTDADLAERRVPTVSNVAFYQQRPIIGVNTIFDRELFRFYRQLGVQYHYQLGEDDKPEHVNARELPLYFAIDLATSTKTRADFTAISRGRFDQTNGRLFVEDIEQVKLDAPRLQAHIENLVATYGPRKIFIESSSFQLSFVQLMQARLRDKRVIVEGWKRPAHESKDDGAAFTASRIADGSVYFAETGARSMKLALEQIASYPLSADGHDDCVDACGILVAALVGSGSKPPEIRIMDEGGWMGPDAGIGSRSERGGWTRIG
jgi:phage terminase large subunit-like protein